jgi:hypothetical protein
MDPEHEDGKDWWDAAGYGIGVVLLVTAGLIVLLICKGAEYGG